jgi:hypothetical protein
VLRAIALSTAISQVTFAFAPALFGLIRDRSTAGEAAGRADMPAFFVAAALIQLAAAVAYLAGRSRRWAFTSRRSRAGGR